MLLQKRTRIENCHEKSLTNAAYLGALTVNSLVDEIALMVDRKMITTSSQKIKLQLTRAQTTVLYALLLNHPLPADQVYLQMMRNQWLQLLDEELQQETLMDSYRGR